jgi:hypothetical protein
MLHSGTFGPPGEAGRYQRVCPGAGAGTRLRALLSGFYFRKNAGSCAGGFGNNAFRGNARLSERRAGFTELVLLPLIALFFAEYFLVSVFCLHRSIMPPVRLRYGG